MEYRREIDGLRALAVIPVILFHAGFQAFSGGFVGVDVFFVISGYLITTIILAEKEAGTFSLISFYERRARRILPALFFVMFACLPFAWFWLLPNEMRRFSESLVAVSFFSSNILFYLTSGYFGGGELKPLIHTWSLAVEEQYYVLFPIFLLLTWRLGKRWTVMLLAAVAIVSLMAAQWLSITDPVFNFLLLPTRLWELLLGVFIAFYLSTKSNAKNITGETSQPASQPASFAGLLLITYAACAFDKQTPFPSLYALIPTIGAALIILFATPQTLVGKLLGSKLLVGIGLISYSAYLWHLPLLAFARHRSIDEPSKALLSVLAAAAVILAYLSWRYVEAPFRNRQLFSRKQIFVYGTSCSVLFVTFGLAGHFNEGFQSRMPTDVLAVDITRIHEQLLKDSGCNLHSTGFDLKDCIRGDKSIPPNYALIGDSHAQALVFELSAALRKNRKSFIPYVKTSCPLCFAMPPDADNKDCAKYQNQIFKDISNNNVGTYIVAARHALPPSGELTADAKASFEAHKKSIVRLLDLGKKVILIYPIPAYGVPVSAFMAKNILFHGNKLGMISVNTKTFKERISYFYDGYDEIGFHPNLSRVYTDKIFCDTYEKDRCVAQLNGIPLYFDESHLSNAGALLVVKEIMKHIENNNSDRLL